MLKTMVSPTSCLNDKASNSAPRRRGLLRCCLAVVAYGLALTLQAHDNHHQHSSMPEIDAVEGMTLIVEDLERFERTGADDALIRAQQLSYQLLSQSNDTNMLYLAARAAQAGHQFDHAHTLLGELLGQQPQHNSARLLQSSLFAVQGKHLEAGEACHKLMGAPVLVSLVCQIAAQSQPSLVHREQLRALIERNLMAGYSHRMQAWILGVAGDLAAQHADYADAEQHYRRAHALHPSIRLQAALCDVLLAQNKTSAVLELTSSQPLALPLTVKRLVALARSNQPLSEVADKLAKDFAQQQKIHDYRHGREMAEFYFEVLDNPTIAKKIIQKTLLQQQEFEDRLLLARINLAL